jgi:DNA-binding NtrC family response regulator
VDDERSIAGFAAKAFRRLGYEVQAFTDSRAALEAFRESPTRFDLLITDQTMPELTGIDLSERIRDIRPGLPVILCTGLDNGEIGHLAARAGIRKVLTKPYDMNRMARAIREILPDGASIPAAA